MSSDEEDDRYHLLEESGDNNITAATPHVERKWNPKSVLIHVAVSIVVLTAFNITVFAPWKKNNDSVRKNSDRRLVYRKNEETGWWTFTILQLADLHLGEDGNTHWWNVKEKQDPRTWKALDSYMMNHHDNNLDIDLIVLSGDQLTANNCYPGCNASEFYIQLGNHLSKYDIPFAMIFGNHDDMPGDGTGIAATTRRALLDTLQNQFGGPRGLSLTQSGPSNVSGTTNYWLDLYFGEEEDNATTLGSRLVFFDTGGGQLPQVISPEQLDWFREENQRYPQLPVVAFAHIPVMEFADISPVCVGENNEHGVSAPTDGDAGLAHTLLAATNVHVLASGHDHGNDYCCPFLPTTTTETTTTETTTETSLHLCFGRHSGYGGYGRWARGARIYQLQILSPDDTAPTKPSLFRWKSWVLMESGSMEHVYDPFARHSAVSSS